MGRRLRSSLLAALCVACCALPGRAAALRTAPQRLASGISLHLANLNILAELPRTALDEGPLRLRPGQALGDLPIPQLQTVYMREAAALPQPDEAAAGVIVQIAAEHPALIGRIETALEDASPGDPDVRSAMEGLRRWAQGQSGGAAKDDPAAMALARRKLDELFAGPGHAAAAAPPESPARNGGASRQGELLVLPHAVRPGRAQVDAWLAQDASDPVELALGGIDPVLADELLEQAYAPPAYRAAAGRWLRGGDARAKASLLERPDLLQSFYELRRRHEGTLRERHGSLPRLLAAYRGSEPGTLQRLLGHAVKRADGYAVEHDARTWSLLPPERRDEAAGRLEARGAGGLKTARLFLELGPKTALSDLARRYSLGRDPKVLERYLSLRLRRGRGDVVRVPLEDVMPPWVRRAVNTFEDCSGANCVNAGLGLHAGRGHRSRYVSGEEMLRRLGADFRKVNPDGPLEVGDLLVYTTLGKEFVHMAAYVGGGHVFNKAGDSRYDPYVFQDQAAVEAAHFPRGGMRRLVFRRDPAR